MESGSSSEVEHVYGGDVGEDPTVAKSVMVQAGLASAVAGSGQPTMEEEPASGVD